MLRPLIRLIKSETDRRFGGSEVEAVISSSEIAICVGGEQPGAVTGGAQREAGIALTELGFANNKVFLGLEDRARWNSILFRRLKAVAQPPAGNVHRRV